MRLFAFLFLLACSAPLPRTTKACNPTQISVGIAKLNPGEVGAFGVTETSGHVQYLTALNSTDYRKDGAVTLECVDARANHAIVGTPGGDLAEFAGAVAVYYASTSKTPDIAGIRSLFQSFVAKYITVSRPFYFHTDDGRLRQAFAKIGEAVGRNITVFPVNGPPASEQATWLTELTASYAQGCGHIRLMISNFADYGLTSSIVPQGVIQVFFEELWKASPADKPKYDFQIKLGPLIGKAIGIVSNGGPSCTGYSPAVIPSSLGSSIFVYTPGSATAFRKNVLTPFFVGQQGSNLVADTFNNALGALQTTQLNATLTLLNPANNVSLLTVTVNTTGTPTTTNTGGKAALAAVPAIFQAIFGLGSLIFAKVLLN